MGGLWGLSGWFVGFEWVVCGHLNGWFVGI